MPRLVMALLLTPLLSGCLSSGVPIDPVDAADDAQCQTWGAQPLTPVYIHCRTVLYERRQTVAASLVGTGIMPGPVLFGGGPPPPPGPMVIHSRY
jgi:hypothetical protein